MPGADTTWQETRHKGISIKFLRRDSKTGDVTALIRMQSGQSYPEHRHEGIEEVYVIDGGYRDQAGEHRKGDYVLYQPGSVHHPEALPGPDCVLFAVARGGITITDGPRDELESQPLPGHG